MYVAEALYLLVEIGNQNQNLTFRQLKSRILSGLYRYMYADRVVAASKEMFHRNRRAGKEVRILPLLGFNLELIEKDRPIDFLEMVDDVCRTEEEKDFVRLILEGRTEEEISKIMHIRRRIVQDIRAGIVEKLRSKM